MSERKPPPSHPEEPPSTNQRPILEPAVDPEARAGHIHRRHVTGFLAGLVTAMPLAAGFSWLSSGCRTAHPGPASPEPPPSRPVPPAFAATLRPRLLIILPEDVQQQYDLGHALGEYLNHGTDEALAPLAAVDLSCIAASEIDLPVAAMGRGPLALLLIAGDTQRLVRFELPGREELRHGDDAATERVVDQRIEIVSAAVQRAVMDLVLGLSPRMLAHPRVQEIATRARAGYPIADWRTPGSRWISERETDAARTRGEPLARSLMPDEAAHFAPALLAVAVSAEDEVRKSLLGTLAAVARRRVVDSEVPGAEWATSGGCGIEFENRESQSGVACGMGFVPERSRRFLHFYTLKPSNW